MRRVTTALDARHPEALDPLPDQRLPLEVQPLVRALNGLLDRLATALDIQKEKAFVADAAHELRTPLAAVQIQSQLVARAKDDATRSEALADLQAGVTRATRLAEQLLALARSEPDGVVATDAEALRVMFNNLVDNATKYTPRGGRVDVGLRVEEGHPVVRIADSGPGIDPEERHRVFDRF